jgi:hypothetical protein
MTSMLCYNFIIHKITYLGINLTSNTLSPSLLIPKILPRVSQLNSIRLLYK